MRQILKISYLLYLILPVAFSANGTEKNIEIFDGLFWGQKINDVKKIVESKGVLLSNKEVKYEYKMNKSHTIGGQEFDISFIIDSKSGLIEIMAVSNYSSKRSQDDAYKNLSDILSSKYDKPKQGFKNSNTAITTNRLLWKTQNSFITLTMTQRQKSSKFLTILSYKKTITKDDDEVATYSNLQENKVMMVAWADIPILIALRTFDDLEFIKKYSKYVYDPKSKSQKYITTLWQEDYGLINTDDKIYTSTTRSYKNNLSVFSGIGPVSGCSLQFYNVAESAKTNIEAIDKLRALKIPAINLYYDSCSGALYDNAGRSIITGTESPNLNIPKHTISSYSIKLSVIP